MLADPQESDESIGAIGYVLREAILVHQVVGIYESESRFAQKYGPDALLDKLAKQGLSRNLDEFRPSAV